MSLATEFIPRDWQAQIIGDPQRDIPEDDTKYKVVVAHRKAGKTVGALMYLFMMAYRFEYEHKGQGYRGGIRTPRFTYIAPTYKQAKDIAWDLLKSIVPRWGFKRKPNETNMEIRLAVNGAILNIKGADKEDSLRGPGLQYALLDEVGYMKPYIWENVIRPELASTGGGAMFIGTPNGRDKFYDLFKLGRDGAKDWKSWLLPATKPTLNFAPGTPRGQDLLASEFLQQAKVETTEKFYNQEYECDFIDDAGMVFDRVEENVHDDPREFPEPGHRYRIGFDPALREDWSVLAVLDLTDHRVKYVYRTNKIDLELLLERVQNMVNTWTTNVGAPEVIMDTTGMGDPVYEALATRGVSIRPVKFTSESKRRLVDGLALKLNKDELQFPRYDWLIDELKDYRYERLPSGRYRYGAPAGKHDDGVTALMLCVFELPPKQAIRRARQESGGFYQYNRFTGI